MPRARHSAPNLGNRLDGADLIISIHNGYERGILPQGGGNLFDAYNSVLMHIEERCFKAFPLEPLDGVEHRVMLKFCGDNMTLPHFYACISASPRMAQLSASEPPEVK